MQYLHQKAGFVKKKHLCIVTGMVLYMCGLVLFMLAARSGGALFQLLPVSLLLLGTAFVCLALHVGSMQ
jgi:hypothetical protein